MEEYCVCGHRAVVHLGWESESTGCTYSSTKFIQSDYGCECSEFKLDNLRFVEDEAKRRNLI